MSPDAVSVSVLNSYRLSVRFENGEARVFDAAPLLSRKCYQKLRNCAFFGLAKVQYGVVTWPGNIDIDPDWLYQDSVPLEERASWDPDFTKLTPAETAALQEAEAEIARGETVPDSAIDWDAP